MKSKTEKQYKLFSMLNTFFNPFQWTKSVRGHFLINICIGILIAIFMFILEHQPIGRTILNVMVDKLVEKEFNEYSGQVPESMVFIDIDSKTDNLWNGGDSTVTSLITNRNKLAQLLEIVEKSNPKVIVLDIDLSLRSNPAELDNELIAFFDDFTKRSIQGSTQTNIVLPANINEHNTRNKCFLDDYIAKNPLICQASSFVATEISDRTIRYIVDYKITANNDTVWSIPLTSYALYNDMTCKQFSSDKFDKLLNIRINHSEQSNQFGLNTFTSRIRYLLRPPSILNQDTIIIGNMDGDNQNKSQIRFSPIEFTGVVDPYDFLDQAEKDYILSGKIVVIGNSSLLKNDFHRTPIGDMAGMFVIGNAINTYFIGQVNHLSYVWIFLIELFVILFVAYMFLHLHSVAAEVVAIIAVGIPLYFLTIHMFEVRGTVINVIFTMLGIATHRFISGLEDMFSVKGRKQHKN